MKEDIVPPVVTDIGMAITQEEDPDGNPVWNCYLINLKVVKLEGVIVASKGYGEIGKEKRKTSMLRHFLDEVSPKSFKKVEPIMEDVFGMFNEYWLTYFQGGKMYDRRFIFVPESISERNFTELPLMKRKGVLIL